MRGGNPGQPERTVPTHSGPAHIVGVGDQQAATGGQTDAHRRDGCISGFLQWKTMPVLTFALPTDTWLLVPNPSKRSNWVEVRIILAKTSHSF